MTVGHVHSIESMGLVDGPGIRTVIFLQGCALRCRFCHNPDTWELSGGTEYTPEELVAKIRRFKPYFKEDGGVTFSGGEPMMQAEILYDLCNRLQKEHISVAFETALAFPWKVIHRMTECADLFLVDFKMFDNEKHKEYTGTENTLIKENLKKLVNYRPIMIRLPIIKGINDEIENAVATADFFAALGKNIKSVEFLPYHDFGVEKAKHVGVNQQMFEAPDEKQLEQLKEVYRSRKLNVVE